MSRVEPSDTAMQSSDLQERLIAANRPTRVRWRTMLIVAIVGMLTYLDRLNLSIAGKYIQDEFSFNTQTMGWILSAFSLGYAACQIPAGWASDRYGPRKLQAAAMVWWSVFTASTAVAPALRLGAWPSLPWTFAILRFLTGAGESTTSLNSTKIVSSWLGATKRGLGSSFNILGLGLGGALTPILIASAMQRWGWRTTFYFCGALGGVVALLWLLCVTDTPEEHSGVNAAELALIHGHPQTDRMAAQRKAARTNRPPYGKMFKSRSVRGLLLGYLCQGYAMYFYHAWFFLYLVRVRGLTLTQAGLWGASPYLAIALLSPLGGWFSDRAVRRLGRHRGRQVAAWLGMTCSATLMWVGGHAAGNRLCIFALAAAAGANMFAATTWWATCVDLAPSYSGSLSGLMNMFGNFGGWISPVLTAYVATHLGWTQALDLGAVLTLIGGLLWIFVNAGDDVEATAPAPSSA